MNTSLHQEKRLSRRDLSLIGVKSREFFALLDGELVATDKLIRALFPTPIRLTAFHMIRKPEHLNRIKRIEKKPNGISVSSRLNYNGFTQGTVENESGGLLLLVSGNYVVSASEDIFTSLVTSGKRTIPLKHLTKALTRTLIDFEDAYINQLQEAYTNLQSTSASEARRIIIEFLKAHLNHKYFPVFISVMFSAPIPLKVRQKHAELIRVLQEKLKISLLTNNDALGILCAFLGPQDRNEIIDIVAAEFQVARYSMIFQAALEKPVNEKKMTTNRLMTSLLELKTPNDIEKLSSKDVLLSFTDRVKISVPELKSIDKAMGEATKKITNEFVPKIENLFTNIQKLEMRRISKDIISSLRGESERNSRLDYDEIVVNRIQLKAIVFSPTDFFAYRKAISDENVEKMLEELKKFNVPIHVVNNRAEYTKALQRHVTSPTFVKDAEQ